MILALDLGSATGWCLHYGDRRGVHSSGTWKLDGDPTDRVCDFATRLMSILDCHRVDRVVYEQAWFHKASAAAHLYGAFKHAAIATARSRDIEAEAVSWSTVKAFAGHGRFKKGDMIKAANKRWPGHDFKRNDDDEVDARWIAQWAAERILA